jgi:DnaJ like chaperone protein
MSWWGKVVGGAFGYLLGGPLGALLGVAIGHQFDKGLGVALREQGWGTSAAEQERIQAAFFTATFSIMGHIAKADGRVSEDEIFLARQVMARMRLSDAQKKAAIALFSEGKQVGFALDDILDQFKRECHQRRTLLQMFLEIQIFVALADGQLHADERNTLLHICQRLGFSRAVFEQLVAMVQAQQQFAGAAGAGAGYRARATIDDAYAVLGISSAASDADVKKAYRRLISQHHPDKLVSKGLPEEMMQLAKEKTQEIQAAYEQVKQARGMR